MPKEGLQITTSTTEALLQQAGIDPAVIEELAPLGASLEVSPENKTVTCRVNYHGYPVGIVQVLLRYFANILRHDSIGADHQIIVRLKALANK